MTRVSTAAARAIFKLARNFSRISTPCVRVAAIVVSEIIDRLSPNIAPPTTTPRQRPGETSRLWVKPIAIGANATTVPTDVPIASEMKQPTRNSPGSSHLPGIIAMARWTVPSTAPIILAVLANAPARIKIKHIDMMSTLPMPWANSSTLLRSDAL